MQHFFTPYKYGLLLLPQTKVVEEMDKLKKELSIDDRLDQIIDMKKSENSALKKIAISLQKTKPKSKIKNK